MEARYNVKQVMDLVGLDYTCQHYLFWEAVVTILKKSEFFGNITLNIGSAIVND